MNANDIDYLAEADYNDDNLINEEDLFIFIENYYLTDRPDLTDAKYYGYAFDGLGSVIGLTYRNDPNQTGDPNELPYFVETYTYDPFGMVTIYDPNGLPLSQSAIGNPYMFTARRLDPESGLYYYRFRMYSSELGRFLQTDPIGYYDSMNLYQYCGNNPINWIDPYGLFNWKRFRRGSVNLLIGAAQVVGGVSFTVASGGVGGALGGVFVSISGFTQFSVGIVQMVSSYKDCEDVVDSLPTTYSGMIALPFGPLAVDIASGTERTMKTDKWLDLFADFLIDWEEDLYK